MYIKGCFKEIDGIMYASVKSEHQGINIVLWPEVVEKKLKFFGARKSVFKKVNHKEFFEAEINESLGYNEKTDEINWG
jgi:hypothetical protein